jgi:hypothetical protein
MIGLGKASAGHKKGTQSQLSRPRLIKVDPFVHGELSCFFIAVIALILNRKIIEV